MEKEYNYWVVEYISCESNNRWLIVRSEEFHDREYIKDNIQIGGCGDDIAEIKDIYETNDNDYSIDLAGEFY